MKIKPSTLYTKSGENFNKENWNIYPRPQLKRDSFLCLNGEWNFTTSKSMEIPTVFNKKIVVPFPPQSILSGINDNISDDFYLFYQRQFSLPKGFNKGKVLLNFGAVDQKAIVYINGKKVGEHSDGYTPFSFDISQFLQEKNAEINSAFLFIKLIR